MVKTPAKVNKFTIWLILGTLMSGCAIMDLEPAEGFPDNLSEGEPSLELLPSNEYDFHNNPRL